MFKMQRCKKVRHYLDTCSDVYLYFTKVIFYINKNDENQSLKHKAMFVDLSKNKTCKDYKEFKKTMINTNKFLIP